MSKNPLSITQGVIDLSFHQVVAAVFRAVLSSRGITVSQVISAPHEQAWTDLATGRTDILVGWLEGSHGAYLQPFEDRVTVLGDPTRGQIPAEPIYDPYCIWGVPDYVPEEEIKSIKDLAIPEVAEKFTKKIQGINPGAGISRFSIEIIQKYGLDAHGFSFTPGDIPSCCAAFEEAYSKKEWIIIPLWHPQYLHSRYAIRALDDPDTLLRSRDAARLVISNSLIKELDSDTINALRRVRIGNDGVAKMDYWASVEGLGYDEAAKRWINERGSAIHR